MDISKSDLHKNIDLNPKKTKVPIKKTNPKTSEKVEIPTKNQIKDISIKTLLDSLSKDLSTNTKSKIEVLNILKQNDITLNVKNILGDLKSLIELLKSDKILSKNTPDLEKLLLHVKKLDADSLKGQIEKSGIFLESKLARVKPTSKAEIFNDIKATLLLAKERLNSSNYIGAKDTLVQVDKVLTQINYYQLLSFSGNANISYLPLSWDGLEEGQISLKKLKQNRFFCEINLKLKEFGKIDLMVMLFDDININISVFTQNDNFLNLVKENLDDLKRGINAVGLLPSNVYLYDSLKDDKIKQDTKTFVDNQQLGMGINIHV